MVSYRSCASLNSDYFKDFEHKTRIFPIRKKSTVLAYQLYKFIQLCLDPQKLNFTTKDQKVFTKRNTSFLCC